MASLNKVMLIGNLGRDPETRYTSSGDPVCTFSIATTDTWKDKSSGEKREATEWHRIVMYRRLAEISGQYLKKGSQVYIEGRLKTRKWQDQNGQERYTTEIEGTEMKMLGSRSGEGAPSRGSSARDGGNNEGRNDGRNNYAPPPNQIIAPSFPTDMDDDIPF